MDELATDGTGTGSSSISGEGTAVQPAPMPEASPAEVAVDVRSKSLDDTEHADTIAPLPESAPGPRGGAKGKQRHKHKHKHRVGKHRLSLGSFRNTDWSRESAAKLVKRARVQATKKLSKLQKALEKEVKCALWKGRKSWYNKPRIVVDWNHDQEERKATWFELFYDLIFVAACIKMGSLLKSDLTVFGALTFFTFFFYLWVAWTGLSANLSRFSMNDSAHRISQFLHVISAVGMAAHITVKDDMPANIPGFCASFILARVAQVGMWAEVAYYGKPRPERAIPECWLMIRATAVIAALCIIASFLEYHAAIVLLFAAGVLDTTLIMGTKMCIIKGKDKRLPIHVEHMAERIGLFVMLVMGETMISATGAPIVHDYRHFGALVFGVGLMYLLQHLYFESQPTHVSEHAYRMSVRQGASFHFLHALLGPALLAVGVGIKIITLHATDELHSPDAVLMCVSTAVAILSTYLIRGTHAIGFESTLGGGGHHRDKVWVKVFRLLGVGASLLPIIGVANHTLTPINVVGILTGITFALVVVDTVTREISTSPGGHGHGHGHGEQEAAKAHDSDAKQQEAGAEARAGSFSDTVTTTTYGDDDDDETVTEYDDDHEGMDDASMAEGQRTDMLVAEFARLQSRMSMIRSILPDVILSEAFDEAASVSTSLSSTTAEDEESTYGAV